MVEVMKKVSGKYEENYKAARINFPKALVLDVTKDGLMKKLDPTYPLGRVEVPGMKVTGLSLRGVWEGLKIFKRKKEIDVKWMNDERKLGMERGCKSWGELEGIKIGEEVVGVEDGVEIFKELYERLMQERCWRMLDGIRREAEKKTVVLLDYMGGEERPFNHVEMLRGMIAA